MSAVRFFRGRRPGISVLLAAQDEEYVVGLSIRSFLEFGDEVIVVDNGSRDSTRQIARRLADEYPGRVRFFDRPDLADLHQNRAFALEQARFEWVVRADSDYVCYTDGLLGVEHLRRFVLSIKRSVSPEVIWVPQVNVFGDFLHTGKPMRPGGSSANPERQYLLDVTSTPMPRVYRTFPGFGFVRRGRRETTRLLRLMKAMTWPHPVWMHCTIKSDLNLFRRSERTNWRQLGDYTRFPTLDDYIHSILPEKYATSDLAQAASQYMERQVLPHLERYDVRGTHPYPALVLQQLQRNPIFVVDPAAAAPRSDPQEPARRRRFLGFDPERAGLGR